MKHQKEEKAEKGDLVLIELESGTQPLSRVGVILNSYDMEAQRFGEILLEVKSVYDVYIDGHVVWATGHDIHILQRVRDI